METTVKVINRDTRGFDYSACVLFFSFPVPADGCPRSSPSLGFRV